MKFGPTPVAQAEGAILAHGVAAGGVNFKKGRTLSQADIEGLKAARVQTVIIARLGEGDVPEDVAAARIGRAAQGANTTLSTAHTGRTNLYASERGLLVVDRPAVDAINAIDESVTVATLNSFEPVEPRQMLATIKIIPFSAFEKDVAAAEEIARATPLVRVAPFRPKRIALISTTQPAMKTSLLDKNRAVLEARAHALAGVIAFERRCDHDADAVAEAIADCTRQKPT